MSNLSKKDFAQLCGMPTNKLSVYIERKKVIVEDNGFISTKNQVNALFIEKNNKPGKVSMPVQTQSNNPTEPIEPIDTSNLSTLSILELEKVKKAADIEKLLIETRISLLKEEKLMGSAMPVDMVKTIVANLSKAFIGEFKNGADDIIRMLVKTKAYDHNEVSEIRGKLSSIINEAMKKSLSTAKKEMKAIVDNYTETRGVGEHD